MRVTPLAEIAELSDGLVIEAIAGTVKSIYKRREGTGDSGPYSFQDLVLVDKGVEVKAALSGRPPFPQELKGKRVLFTSTSGNHGLNGVKVLYDDYKQANVVRITGTATIEEFGAAQGAAPQAAPQAPARQPAPAPANVPRGTNPPPAAPRPPAPASNPDFNTDKAVKELNRYLAKAHNLWGRCYDASVSAARGTEKHGDMALPPDKIKEVAALFFIQATRDGWLASMPVKMPPSNSTPPPAAAAPEPPPAEPEPANLPPDEGEDDSVPF